MKGFIAVILACLCVSAKAEPLNNDVVGNNDLPAGMPRTIQIQRMPTGSGLPAAGVTSGFSTATAVADGLYHVPNYLPFSPYAGNIWPRVVQVHCVIGGDSQWMCSGYEINGILARGEDIYVQPVLDPTPVTFPRAVIPAPVPKPQAEKRIRG
jgi:hypothetical protein